VNLDRRVTAVAGDGPALVYTFVCSVQSDLGRELERVVAVRLTATGEPDALNGFRPPGSGGHHPTNRSPREASGRKHFLSWGADRRG